MSPPSPTSWPAGASRWPTSSTAAAATPSRWATPRPRAAGPTPSRTSPPPWTPSPAWPVRAPGGRCPPYRPHRPLRGGHLALWAAARHVLPADSPWRLPEAAPLRGVVALAPIADFTVAERLAVCEHASLQLLGGSAHFEQRLPYADPARLLPTGVATTLVQGRADLVVPEAVSESYADAAANAGELVGLTLLADVGHFPLIDPAADACITVAEEIAQLAW